MKSRLAKLFVGSDLLDDEDSLAIYAKDWTTYFKPHATAVVFPHETQQVKALVEFARKEKVALVPSGGRTGLSGGAVALNGEVVVSFEKMNRILDFNELDLVVRVQSGVVTDQLKDFAADKGYFYPVAFSSTGSSQLGGNLATNAGGINVLRYGLTRNWVAGLQAVTGRAEILNLNHGLTKNATGYDLRHLLIGSEGTLGLITEAELRLTRQPLDTRSVLLAVSSWTDALKVFVKLRKELDLLAFEIFDRKALEKVLSRSKGEEPFGSQHSLHVILETELSPHSPADFLENLLGQVFDEGLAQDGVVSQSSTQARDLWSLRENISESIAPFKPYKNDISVRTSRIPEFVRELEVAVVKAYPDFEVLWFGHVGDGNLHLNILKPAALAVEDFVKKCREVDVILFACVQKFEGSISAEHGVGLTKKDFLKFTRSPEEIAIMKELKKLFDPDLILNPGKIFDM